MPFDPKLLLLLAPILVIVSVFLSGNAIRAQFRQAEYFELEGEKLKYRSAIYNGTNYGLCIEFLVASEHLGFRCYFPKFNFVTKYDDMRISRSKALLGSLIKLEMPAGEIKISNRLAKEIDRLSGGKLGYIGT